MKRPYIINVCCAADKDATLIRSRRMQHEKNRNTSSSQDSIQHAPQHFSVQRGVRVCIYVGWAKLLDHFISSFLQKNVDCLVYFFHFLNVLNLHLLKQRRGCSF
ncbi:unnamed protein product [Orchesella dallaii]|uniref:Uncharacterized protein n=1 Tax=Orchesella dallaii TaxID=48710 RepID=A0ABP1R466_9HEXA